jgi:enamine deaminase RidA (YjgF/YER057c/UK114 family)
VSASGITKGLSAVKPEAFVSGPLPIPQREHSRALDLTRVHNGQGREFHLTIRPLPGEPPAQTVHRLARVLGEHKAVIARHEVFGALSAHEPIQQSLRQEFGRVDWPITYVQGGSCENGPLAGMHVLAVADAEVQTVFQAGRIVGRSYQDPWARYLSLGDLRPAGLDLPKPDQARQVYVDLESCLGAAGMGMPQLGRTWLFLDDILGWYGPFNDVRTEFYRRCGVFERVVPASTGVSGRNVSGGALAAAAWAALPLRPGFSMTEVSSPKQCPAPCYGSSFSRAVELLSPALRRIMVSGTASIEPGGASVCQGDVEAQIDLTMEVVRAILVSRQLDYPDVSRATAYFKRTQDARLFDAWRRARGLEAWPLVCTQADICRDELLFEIELDALGVGGATP